jgi:2-oxoglutarate/2-oxoacid ferredoxin oxidoreductase subunit alpha
VLAPQSVQEMADFVGLGFDLAFKYRNPVMILTDGALGQMMEKVWLDEQKPRLTEYPSWATTGKSADRERNIITSLDLDPLKQEKHNHKIQAKYRKMKEDEVRFEMIECNDAEYIFVAYGTSARICQKSVQLTRARGIKAGLLRPITLFPFPEKPLKELAEQVKGILTVEMSTGQMVEDVMLAVNGRIKVEFYGRMGGVIPSPDEIVIAMENLIKKTN